MFQPESDNFASRKFFSFLFTALFFVSPLIFFTDLTRNPYYFQITLLNVSVLIFLLAAGIKALRKGEIPLSRGVLNLPFLVLAAVFLAATAYSLANHNSFFRPAVFSEGLKRHLFLLVNCFLVFHLSRSVPFSRRKTNAGKWAYFLLLWPLLWLFYPVAKTQSAGSFFDPYGFFVWTAGVLWLICIFDEFSQENILHLVFTAAAISSAYGILQYFGVEIIWSKKLNPYGNRSVSTFGNPNFISSYLVMLLPLVSWYLINARKAMERIFYGLVFLSCEAMLLASLTRSSWMGAAAAVLLFLSFKKIRVKAAENKKFLAFFCVLALAVFAFWPDDNLKPMSSAVAERVTEGVGKVTSAAEIGLDVSRENVYPSLHQRLLIWTSAWQMGLENPLTGKGWGLFELFYPFYQGPLLEKFPGIRGLRTHANNAHNEILEVFSQAGIAGLGVYAWFFSVLFFAFLKSKKRLEEENDLLPFAAIAALAGMFVDNMLNVSIHFAVPALLFWWLTGSLDLRFSGPGGRPERRRAPVKPAAARFLSALAILFSLWGIWHWRCQMMREVYYFAGFKQMREVYYFAGFKQMRKQNFREAADNLEKAHRFHSSEVNANYELANAYVRLKEYKKAKWAYTEALKSNCGYDEIFFNRAIVWKKLGEYGKALKDLKISAFINPLNRANFSAISEVYMKLGNRRAKAISVLERGLRIFPGDVSLLNALGYFCALDGKREKAADYYRLAAVLNPDDSMIVSNFRLSLETLGIKNDADMKWIGRYRAAAAKVNSGNVSPKLLDECDSLLKEKAGNLAAAYLKARILFALGKDVRSKEILAAILSEEPKNVNALYALGVVLEKEGDCVKAREKFEKILSVSPGNENVKKRLEQMRCNY